MATPFTSTPILGVDLNTTTLAADVNTTTEDAPQLGTQVFASNGKIYVYGQAGVSINASDVDCALNVTTFVAAASGGAYLSPPLNMATGDRGWFSRAGV